MQWMLQWTLPALFWASELIVLTLVLSPPIRFLRNGWHVRKQEFTNRLKGKNISVYLDRFWDQSLASDAAISKEPNDKKFSYVYDVIVGKSLYTSPLILLACTTFIFGGLVISTAIRSGYEQYIIDYISWSKTEEQLAPSDQQHMTMPSIDAMVMPFSRIDLTLSSMAAIAGAYLYVVGIVIKGYRRRTLLSSDLWWCSFRLIISIPLGLSISLVASQTLGAFIGFSLGAFPMDSLTRILRRLSSRALNDTERKDDAEQLVGMLGVTPNVAAELGAEGVESVQQLCDVDPVSLALRTGLSFDYILNLVSQSQAWSFIGATAGALAPLGLGDARIIAALVDSIDAGESKAIKAIKAAAKKIEMDSDLLEFNFRNIASDKYTKFLTGLA